MDAATKNSLGLQPDKLKMMFRNPFLPLSSLMVSIGSVYIFLYEVRGPDRATPMISYNIETISYIDGITTNNYQLWTFYEVHI
jgi:hypothetical protein